MARGDHFKKPNPRNYQISFKVNDVEQSRLNVLAKAKNMTVAEWIREQIDEEFADLAHKSNGVKCENPKDISKNQMSLF